MQLGMIGLGRMGGNMSRRLMGRGHAIVAYDHNPDARRELAADGATAAESLQALAARLTPPRAVWMMIPADFVDRAIDDLARHLATGDIIIDGGNSNFHDDPRRADRLASRGIEYVDVGTSGGVWGVERGYCLMIGGRASTVAHLDPIFSALAPGVEAAARRPGRSGPPSAAERGYLHCGPHGAGHFVKMVHNAIEYGMMAAYAEGFNVLQHAPNYSMDLTSIAEVWRRGSVVGSWLLDLTAAALDADPKLEAFAGRVGDSGEGRWTAHTAIDAAVPVPVLAAALFARFSSRGEDEFANRLLSAMRAQFGGHQEPAKK
ncbi:MAG TPA: decarboxylating 6-phosphogluconate dehydrogenase [Vicinamibacterales bacterium]|nr:decarboxylating 6-phosphogluconate dehydrogenase [Vicinamibacterales bacterium]